MAPAQHPAYLHALTDLRSARSYLARPANVVVKWDEKKAIHEIDEAIHEINKAAINDGKPIEMPPPADTPTWGGRLQRAAELVGKARADVAEEEDNPNVRMLRQHSLEHMSLAEKYIKEGIDDARNLHETPAPMPAPPPPPMENAHPAYLHGLSDLRHARALLEKPARPDVKWDENVAIREIDAAIKEIRDASIDDGKPLSEHPPIDANLAHRDRLKKAEELLVQTSRDIEQKEDNGFAKGLRDRALKHVRIAYDAVKQAVEERKEDKKHGH